MARIHAQLILRDIDVPRKKDMEEDLEWLCQSLGLRGEEDRRDELGVEIFKSLVRATYKNEPVRSTIICRRVNVSRGAVVYHLNRFIEMGLVVRRGREYTLRRSSLSRTLEEMESDMERMIRRMREIAEYIDSRNRR